MKRLIIILLFVIVNVWGVEFSSEISEESGDPFIFKGLGILVNMKIKSLIKQLKASDPSIDPLVMDSMPLKLDLGDIKLDLVNTGNITGVLGLKVVDLIMVGIPCPKGDPLNCITLNYKVEFPEIDIDITEYVLDGSFSGLFLFGQGKLKLNIKKLILQGTDGIIRNNAMKFSLEKMDIKISLDSIAFEITGWANDEVRSKALSKLVTENVPEFLNMFQTQISETLNELIMKLTDGKFIQI